MNSLESKGQGTLKTEVTDTLRTVEAHTRESCGHLSRVQTFANNDLSEVMSDLCDLVGFALCKNEQVN